MSGPATLEAPARPSVTDRTQTTPDRVDTSNLVTLADMATFQRGGRDGQQPGSDGFQLVSNTNGTGTSLDFTVGDPFSGNNNAASLITDRNLASFPTASTVAVGDTTLQAPPGQPGAQQGDGNFAVVDANYAARSFNSDAQQERTRMDQAIANADLTPEQRAELTRNLAALDSRQPPPSPEQLAQTYDAVSDLLTAAKNNPEQADRLELAALGILDNAGKPSEIDQGYHNTCNVTTLEERMYTQSPGTAAQLVAEAALTGQYRNPQTGQVTQIDPGSLSPDAEARLGEVDGKRNYASQVFQVTTINEYHQQQNPDVRYINGTPSGAGDTGERLVYTNGQPVRDAQGNPINQPNLGTEALARISENLGMNDKGFIISNTAIDGRDRNGGDANVRISSEQDLQNILNNPNTQYPLVIMVHSGHGMFTGSEGQGGRGGWHVVSINGPADANGNVQISNQWGKQFDKPVNVSDLYEATLPPQRNSDGSMGWQAYRDSDGYQGYRSHAQGGADQEQQDTFHDTFERGQEGNRPYYGRGGVLPQYEADAQDKAADQTQINGYVTQRMGQLESLLNNPNLAPAERTYYELERNYLRSLGTVTGPR